MKRSARPNTIYNTAQNMTRVRVGVRVRLGLGLDQTREEKTGPATSEQRTEKER